MADKIGWHFDKHTRIVSDINEHLPTLCRYAAKCEVIAELGVRGIVSTWAFLQGLTENNSDKKELLCVDIEKIDMTETIAIAEEASIDLTFFNENSATVEFGKNVDLLFIDTWHIYGHMKRELNFHHARVNKYIIMHDTTVDAVQGSTLRCGPWEPGGLKVMLERELAMSGYPVEEICNGVWPAIEEFLAEHPEWKILEKMENNNGLTVLHKA
jgi:cephalosporin hydroxylase